VTKIRSKKKWKEYFCTKLFFFGKMFIKKKIFFSIYFLSQKVTSKKKQIRKKTKTHISGKNLKKKYFENTHKGQ
jgi:hypothetical protein